MQEFEVHPITNKLARGATMFFEVRSVQPKVGLANLNVTTLVQTGPTSWGETAYREGTEYVRDENDVPGPVPIAVAVTKKTGHNMTRIADQGRMVVFGDHHFINNKFSSVSANMLLFVFSANWAVGDEYKITIPSKSANGSRLPITQAQHNGIMFFSVNLMPLTIMGLGLSVWAIRRRK